METDILTLAALVAAVVGVIKGLKLKWLPAKYAPLVSLGVAAAFVLVGPVIQSKLVLICSVGLGAAGVYQLAKNRTDGK